MKKADKAPKEAPSDSPQKESNLLDKWWKLAIFVVLILAWTFVALIGSEFLISFLAYKILPREWLSSTVANAGFSLISYVIAALLILWLPTKIPKIREFLKSTKERLGLRGLPTWTDIGLSVVGYIVTIIIAAIVTAIFSNFPWFNANEAQELGYSFYMQGWERGLAFLELAVLAPIMEELIFRGWLYGNLRIRVPKWLAILLVSTLFGLVHMQWNVGITVFIMSTISCSLREITGSIYAGTLMHIINNTVAFTLIYVIGVIS